MECDFCSSPNVVKRFDCRDFDSQGPLPARDKDGKPVFITLKSLSFWAACGTCSRYIEAEDLYGLLGYCLMVFSAKDYDITVGLAQHLKKNFEMFFANRIRIK
jgi:hypothetical protein